MQIHELKRRTKWMKPAAVGRGGKRGKTSGRGGKGQTARAGAKMRPELRDLIKKLPKLRGYAFKGFKARPFPVNLETIEASYKDGEEVNPSTLSEKGIIQYRKGRLPSVKILSSGEISRKVIVSSCLVSAKAKEKIEKAGGQAR